MTPGNFSGSYSAPSRVMATDRRSKSSPRLAEATTFSIRIRVTGVFIVFKYLFKGLPPPNSKLPDTARQSVTYMPGLFDAIPQPGPWYQGALGLRIGSTICESAALWVQVQLHPEAGFLGAACFTFSVNE